MWSKFLARSIQTSSSVEDRMKPDDAALWQTGKDDIAVIDSAHDQTLR